MFRVALNSSLLWIDPADLVNPWLVAKAVGHVTSCDPVSMVRLLTGPSVGRLTESSGRTGTLAPRLESWYSRKV